MRERVIWYLFGAFAVLVIYGAGVSWSNANLHITTKRVTREMFVAKIESRGHFVGWFGQCPYKKDSHYYVPCVSLLTEQELKDFRESTWGRNGGGG